MVNLNVLVNTVSTPLPNGITFSHLLITLIDGAGTNQIQNINESKTIIFNNVNSGTATVTVTAIDINNAAIGNSITNTIDVPVQTYPAPQSITLTI